MTSDIPQQTVEERLQSRLRGDLIQPGDPEYDEAKTIFNAMIDKRPQLRRVGS